ncbi:hypothetical protein [Nocardiopsis sp. YSL2]|uniref:hypothetical protein n=1 Tax=Nocardiopsis sp. YSL2 TaxID=2939492 RepID=UPI0026F45946|nr:hypothetical protein [Nocardiopsis sp. YSL2]
MIFYNAPFVIGAAFLVLAGIATVIGAFAAPPGRKGMTGAAGGLILVSSIVFLILAAASLPIRAAFSNAMDVTTAWMVIGAVDSLFFAAFDAGLILLVFAATRRRTEPRPAHPPHAPAEPYRPGPSQL